MSYHYLSHIVDKHTPGFGGVSDFHFHAVKKLSAGDSCNASRIEMSMHLGTHVDAPVHFSATGTSVEQFPADFWIFKNIAFVDLKGVEKGSILEPGSWCEDVSPSAELLLLKTGFERFRHQDVYWEENPGLSPDLGLWLRKHRPSLRVLGFDFISASSFTNRDLGRKAHRAFLDVNPHVPGAPILLIEDMHLEWVIRSPSEVLAFPLRVAGADGAPMTVIAKL